MCRHAPRAVILPSLLLAVGGGLVPSPLRADAAELQATVTASGDTASSPQAHARVVVGEAVGGSMAGPRSQAHLGFLARCVRRDTTPPTGTVTFNGGATLTATRQVTLTLSATDDSGVVSQMTFSANGTSFTAPDPYAASKSWALAAGDGQKTLVVKFADPSGNWSTPAQATITLDTTPPTIAISAPRDGAVMGNP